VRGGVRGGGNMVIRRCCGRRGGSCDSGGGSGHSSRKSGVLNNLDVVDRSNANNGRVGYETNLPPILINLWRDTERDTNRDSQRQGDTDRDRDTHLTPQRKS
jgi:hypothetical protein